MINGWKAYNITSDPAWGIGAWSDAQLADYLSSSHAEGRSSAAAPMVCRKFEKSRRRDLVQHRKGQYCVNSSRSSAVLFVSGL
jgi:hypothetical protein